jgi:bacterioferritin-associated ferredoxin
VRVCHCKGVSDRQIRSAIEAGARTPVEIASHCRAGTGCGGCLPEVCRLLDDHLTGLAYYASFVGSGCGDCPLLVDDTERELLSA